MRRGFSVFVALLGLFGVSACSGDTDSRQNASIGTIHLAGLLGVAPNDMMNETERFVVEEEERLVAECMAQQGHEYIAAPASAVLAGEAYVQTPETAAENGFGFSTTDPNEGPPEPNPNDEIASKLYRENPTAYDAWQLAHSECVEDAATTVNETLGIQQAVVTRDRLLRELQADDRYQTALELWRDCMEGRGWPASTRDAIVQQFAEEWETLDAVDLGDFRRREIAAAVADAECAVDLQAVEREILYELAPELKQLSP